MRTQARERWIQIFLVLITALEAAGVAHAFLLVPPYSATTSTRSVRVLREHPRSSFSFLMTAGQHRRRRTSQLHSMPIDTTILSTSAKIATSSASLWLSAVEVFDGSDIVDPVVVSNVFWTSLQTKIVSFVLGQILAAAVFSILLAVFASQFGKLSAFVSEQVFPPAEKKNNSNNGIRIPPELELKQQNRGTVAVQPDFFKLLICILVDAVGTSSELVPVLGELTDVVWAPIAGLILRQLYGGGSNNLLWALEFAEEILPFTDVLPLCTLCWVVDTFFGDSRVAQVLRLGQYAAAASTSTFTSVRVIDVEPEESKNNVRGRR